MKLSELQEAWSEDSRIDETNLGREAVRTPQLHAKYLNWLGSVRLNLRKAESDYLNLRRRKYRYYRGEMTRDELESEGWTQFQGNKPLKNEMDEILNTDSELIGLQDKVEYFKTVLNQLEQIVRSINSRTWDVKNSIEWHKFTNGMM
jgi:Recombination, repair and ssDNA binding protein UvsY